MVGTSVIRRGPLNGLSPATATPLGFQGAPPRRLLTAIPHRIGPIGTSSSSDLGDIATTWAPGACSLRLRRHAVLAYRAAAVHGGGGGGGTISWPIGAAPGVGPCLCSRISRRRRSATAGRVATSTAATAATDTASAAPTVSPVDPAVLSIADGLPIREVLAEVLAGLDRSSGLVLQAPPGAGKTTVVPLAMLRHNPEYLRSGERILVLEPRRVAAKGAARRMAASLGGPVGAEVGYRVRLDSQVSSSTRIEVVTEGILLRRLQRDPELAGVGAVVFDEFHERNLDADLALTLCLDVQRLARPELRLVVMSATLGGGLGDRVRNLMAEAAAGAAEAEVPLLVSEGRSYPVRTIYLGRPEAERGALERAAADAVVRALREDGGGGDVLVFLPGVGEIRTVWRLLEEDGVPRKYGARVLQLHGNMAPDEQDEVLRPGAAAAARSGGRRRVVLSTPVAESSITIDGVTAVVDCGLRRAPRYDPATAINRLDTVRISQASAEQRRGRAGRTAPGTCYRMWSDRDPLEPVSEPEILTADLAPAALELALWGSPDGGGLPWLDPPPEVLLAAGRELLQDLGAVDPATGRPTGHGRVLARMGLHPRWGHAVLRGGQLGCSELAAVVATMLGSERDVLRRSEPGGGGAGRSADISMRLEALAREDAALDQAAARRILQGARSMAAMATATVRRNAAATTAAATTTSTRTTSADGSADADDDDAAVVAALRDAGVGSLESADASEDDSAADASDTESAPPPVVSDPVADGGDLRRTAATDNNSSGTSPCTSSSRAGGGGGGGGGGGAAGTSAHSASFDSLWRQQLQREGLVGALVATAYPDRIAERRQRPNSRPSFTLATGQVVRLPAEDDPLGQFDYLAVAEIGGVGAAASWRGGGGGSNDTVRSAAGLSASAIERYLGDMVQEREVVFWASGSKSVIARRQKRLGCLVLSERAAPVTDSAALPALLQGFKEMGGVRGVGLDRDTEAWRQRAIWLRSQALGTGTTSTSSPSSASSASAASPSSGAISKRLAALPDLTDGALLAGSTRWLSPHLAGVRSRADLLKLDWRGIIKSLVPGELQQLVEAEAPSHLKLPSGSRVLVDYSGGGGPVARCRLQEVFGLETTPLLAGGAVPLTLELLSPAGRPAAVTSDLASFWRGAYAEVRRELRGRYPKHLWPEDPLQAEATRLTKKQQEAQSAAAAVASQSSSLSSSGGGAPSGKGTSRKGSGGGVQKRK